MTQFTKEIVATQGTDTGSVVAVHENKEATGFQTIEYLVYFFFGALEILLAFRFVLRLTGANSYNAFVGLIYGITGIFILPFEGIFYPVAGQGAVRTAVFEPTTIVAIVVYSVLAFGLVKLVRIFSGERQQAE